MEKLSDLLETAERALRTLRAVIGIDDANDVVQDAAIQRFEYTFEATWKACQEIVQLQGFGAASPKATIRHAREGGIFTDEDTVFALRLLDLRNKTVHTYNEVLARSIYPELPDIADFFGRWIGTMKVRCAEEE